MIGTTPLSWSISGQRQHGGNEFGQTAAGGDLLRRLASIVKFPVPVRVAVRGVQDRFFEEQVFGFGHGCLSSTGFFLWWRQPESITAQRKAAHLNLLRLSKTD